MGLVQPKNPSAVKWMTGFSFFVVYLPLLALVLYSLLAKDPETDSVYWTFKWYFEALADDDLKSGLWTSLWVGIWTTLGATILGTTAALALERSKFPGKAAVDSLSLVPLIVPEIVFGLSLLIWFVFLNITLGSISMILAHITFSFSYVLITVRARLQDFDLSLEEAAKDLGASPSQTFWRVTFPLLRPAIISGALMAFTISFDDFLISFFTAGIGSDTLPIKLYSMIKFGISPKVNALSSLILLITIILVIAVFKPKKEKRRD